MAGTPKHDAGGTASTAAGRRWWREWGLGLVVVAATVVAYGPALGGGFVWDDNTHITENQTLRSLRGLWAIWFEPGATCQYYPLTFTGFWVGYHLWGLNPVGYHLVNVLLHCGVAVLLWQVLERLRLRGAWLAGAIFALHPVCVMSVAWMTELKNTLSACLLLGSIWAYVRYAGLGVYAGVRRAWGYYGLSVGLFVLAMLAKTAVSFVPVTLLLVVWWQRERVRWREVWPLLPMAGLVAGLGQVTFAVERFSGAVGGDFRLGLLERMLISGRSFWFYIGKLVIPYRLTFIYERWAIDREAWWQYGYPVGVLGLVWGLWRLRGRLGKGPLVAVMHFYVATSLLILLTVLYMTQFSWVSDHWQYYGSMSMVALGAAGMARALDHVGRSRGWLSPVVCGLLLVVLGLLTRQQSRMYGDLETLWRTTLARNPTCWLAHNNWGLALLDSGKTEEGITHFQKALELQPDRNQARNNLGIALMRQGRLEEARGQYERVLALDPQDADAHSNLGAVLLKEGRVPEAQAHFAEALRLRPKYSEPHYNWGRALSAQGRWAEAQGHFEQALALKPGDADAHMDLGVALFKQGRVMEAQGHFEQAVRLKPEYAEGRKQMEAALEGERRALETIGQLERVLQANPGDVAARGQMADTLYALGHVGEAIRQYEELLRQQPDHVEAHYNLGVALLRVGKLAEAVNHYAEVVRLKPEDAEVGNELAWLLATCVETSVRDGARAVGLAEKANQVSGGKVAGILDTLAAAYAEVGRFDDAVRTAQKALALVKQAGQAEQARRIQERVQLYQDGRPYHERPGATP